MSNFNNMKTLMKKTAIALALLLLLAVPSAVHAEEDETTTRSGESFVQTVLNRIKERSSLRREKGQETSCAARQDAVVKRSEQLVKRAKNMEDVFSKIAERVKTYYSDKLVPAGITVSNYDTLVAAIDTKKAAVDTALDEASTVSASFDCSDTTKTKTQVTDFRVAMQKVISALKEFKTSVRNLIVAVHTAAGKLESSPRPSASPEPES